MYTLYYSYKDQPLLKARIKDYNTMRGAKCAQSRRVNKWPDDVLKIGIERTDLFNSDPLSKGDKVYHITHNIGKAKYVVNMHDGVKKHRDGSKFFDIEIFSNKAKLDAYVQQLEINGYRKQY